MKREFGYIVLIFVFCLANISLAEDLELDPITVTAGKRSISLQKIPASISVFDRSILQSSHAEGIEKISEITPNLNLYTVGSRRTSLFYMRGIGSSGPNQPAVGVFVDDVYYPKTGLSNFSMNGIERVEVMRGPQSAIYGRNTEGGAINLVTPTPSTEPKGNLNLSAGEHNYRRAQVHYEGAAKENRNLYYSISGGSFTRDGYTRNEYLNEDADPIDHLSGRMKLFWLPSEDLEFSLSIYADRDRDGGYPLTSLENVRSNPYHVSHNQSASHKREMQVYDLHAQYSTPNYEFTSITAFRDWENRDKYDQDFSPADIQSLYDTDSLHGISQEFRIASQKDSRISWISGLYCYRNSENDDDFTHYGADAGMFGATPGLRETALLGVKSLGIAPFGRIDIEISDKLTSSAGLRYEYQEKEADGNRILDIRGTPIAPESDYHAEQDYDELLPEASISYELSPDFLSYVRVARGFREGGFNNGESGPSATYAPEKAWSYETGIKSAWLNKRLRVNASIFRMDIEDQQLIQFKPGGYGFSFKNAGESENTGAEVQLVASPLDWLDLRGSFGYVDTEFKSFQDPVLGADYTGNRIPFVPDYNYSASIACRREFVRDLVVKTEFGLTGNGKTYWDEANNVETGEHTLYNASAGLMWGRYELTVFARNLFEEEYPSAVYAFPNSTPTAQPGAPRTIGLMLSADI